MQEIKELDKSLSRKIASERVVVSLTSIVKELIENSIDASSTTIEIVLENYGKDLIEVIDNGVGIKPIDFEYVALPHYTSKLQDYEQLSKITTFGFKGQALSSIANIANLSITTKHVSSSYGYKLVFDNIGHLINKSPCARPNGTTVTVKNLFFPLPVRQKDFNKNCRKHFNEMVQFIYPYAFGYPYLRLHCSNVTGNRRQEIINVTAAKSLKEKIIQILDYKQVRKGHEFIKSSISSEVAEEYLLDESVLSKQNSIDIKGYMSSLEVENSKFRKCYLFINKRPCEYVNLEKMIIELCKNHNKNFNLFLILMIDLGSIEVDINCHPDKRKILLPEEKLLFAIVKSSIINMLNSSNFINSDSVDNSKKRPRNDEFVWSRKCPSPFDSHFELDDLKRSNTKEPGTSTSENKNFRGSRLKLLESFAYKKGRTVKDDSQRSILEMFEKEPDKSLNDNKEAQTIEADNQRIDSIFPKEITSQNNQNFEEGFSDLPEVIESFNTQSTTVFSEELKSNSNSDATLDINTESIKDINNSSLGMYAIEKLYEPAIDKMEVDSLLNTTSNDKSDNSCEESLQEISFISENSDINKAIFSDKKTEELNLNDFNDDFSDSEISDVEKQSEKSFSRSQVILSDIIEDEEYFSCKKSEICEISAPKFQAKIIPKHNEKAESELKKGLLKEMFAKMEIIGQFNAGFIITELEGNVFIIDQHASDERYNFEDLCTNTILESQRLVQPIELKLRGYEEWILHDKALSFERNGFKFEFDESAPSGKRVLLTHVPLSDQWVFGVSDFQEILSKIEETGDDCRDYRPSRVLKMLASRACRKSVMIKDHLTNCKMKKIVHQMSTLKNPWICAHGRPTIRFLFNVNQKSNILEDMF